MIAATSSSQVRDMHLGFGSGNKENDPGKSSRTTHPAKITAGTKLQDKVSR